MEKGGQPANKAPGQAGANEEKIKLKKTNDHKINKY